MKNRKVLNLRTHIGGWFGKTSYDSDLNKADMEICPVGVVIKSIKGAPIIFKGKPVYVISMNSNNIEAIVETGDEVALPVSTPAKESAVQIQDRLRPDFETDEPKRKPGRPPKDVA